MSYPNRTYCQVLEEMRDCYKTYNFGNISGLIEELQTIGNRMEASLYDKRDLDRARREARELEAENKKLKKETEQ